MFSFKKKSTDVYRQPATVENPAKESLADEVRKLTEMSSVELKLRRKKEAEDILPSTYMKVIDFVKDVASKGHSGCLYNIEYGSTGNNTFLAGMIKSKLIEDGFKEVSLLKKYQACEIHIGW